MRSYDVVIVGAGASGMTAAITLKRQLGDSISCCILEKKREPGKKLSITGNGRCNLTNRGCTSVAEIIRFFSSIGVPVREEEEGRIYPYSEDASQVVDALSEEILRLGVEVRYDASVTGVDVLSGGGFQLTPGYTGGIVLLATGGKSYASCGTTGDGYVFARNLGHRVEATVPGLTAVEVAEDIRSLKGLRSKGIAELYRNGQLIGRESGEIQFREDAISGICIMNLSNLIYRDATYELVLNLVPDFPRAELEDLYRSKALLKQGLMNFVIRNRKDPRRLNFRIKGLKGWNEAQITRGGVDITEVNADTMESLKVPGLYLSGEILDVHDRCGGFNLSNAWITGMRAGRGMAERLMQLGITERSGDINGR